MVEIVEPDSDDLSGLERRCELPFDRAFDGELVRVDAAPDEREEIAVELEAPQVPVHLHDELPSVVRLDARNAHRAILPRAVQSAA